PPTATLFPYTTLFRSAGKGGRGKYRKISRLPNLQRPDLTLESERPGAFDGHHPQRVLPLEPGGGGFGQETRVPHAHHRIGAEAEDRKSTRLNSSHDQI